MPAAQGVQKGAPPAAGTYEPGGQGGRTHVKMPEAPLTKAGAPLGDMAAPLSCDCTSCVAQVAPKSVLHVRPVCASAMRRALPSAEIAADGYEKCSSQGALMAAHDRPPLLLKKAPPACTVARTRRPSADEAVETTSPAL